MITISQKIAFHRKELERLEKLAKIDRLEQIACAMGINKDILLYRSRSIEFVDSRRIAMKILKVHFRWKALKIAKAMGMNHANILHHLKAHESLVDTDIEYREFYNKTLTNIKQFI